MSGADPAGDRYRTGAYQAVLDLPLSGTWVLTVSVRTSEFEQPSARIEVAVP